MRFVNTAEAIAEYVFNGVLSEWSKQIRLNEAKKGGW
ncbi:replication initiator protein A [Streptococcus pneumoniae]|nr:replication initiator protein A [Streptococcus pneumoniae]